MWMIDNFVMRMLKSLDFSPDHESSITLVWFTLPKLPEYMYDEEALLICVEFDVVKDPIKEIWISFGKNDITRQEDGYWQNLKYGELQSYCHKCHHLGHMKKKYKVWLKIQEVVSVKKVFKGLKEDIKEKKEDQMEVKEDRMEVTKQIWQPLLKSIVVRDEAPKSLNENSNGRRKYEEAEEGMIESLISSSDGLDFAGFGNGECGFG
ncbi:hypothetical protein LIER_31684 [Lithospermum erythrorhizon]|uniref:DUF4283 domain-containing protein n=1 Tax=Lithospermum erythrorhizon TaxID=34254 RepID=A0AAV3RX06_LITER